MASDDSPPSTLDVDPPSVQNLSLDTKAPPNVVFRSPILNKVSTHHLNQKDTNHDPILVEEMNKHWHEYNGTTEKFLDTFASVDGLPEGVSKDLPNKEISLAGLVNDTREWPMYPIICTAFNKALDEAHARDPRMEEEENAEPRKGRLYCFKDVADTPETSKDDMKIDIAMYRDRARERAAYQLNGKKQTAAENAEAQPAVENAEVQPAVENAEAQPDVENAEAQPDVANAETQLAVEIAETQPTVGIAETQSVKKKAQRTVDPSRHKHLARAAWAWMTVGVEVKRKREDAAFYFGERGSATKGLLRDSDAGRQAQAQLTKYAAELMVRQHRTHVFIIYIAENFARITRWDRVGCVVSKPINLEEQKDAYPLLNFVYRLGLMSDARLGYDTTAVLASEAEVSTLERIKHKNSYARRRAREVLNNQRFFPIYKVDCAYLKGGGSGTYFIGKYISASHSPTGRGTRGYVAFKEGAKRLYFLKDYWRPSSDAVSNEIAIYDHLHSEGVRYIAQIEAGGDVANGMVTQCTVTQIYLYEDRENQIQAERWHVRIVFKELAKPLEEYEDSYELIVVVSHALIAHYEAYEAGVLHRDISVNNIMCVVNQNEDDSGNNDNEDDNNEDDKDIGIKGILNDWDLSKFTKNLGQQTSPHGRSGTWAFMSALSLQFPRKPNSLSDDLESFIYVFTWCALRFHAHDQSGDQLGRLVGNFFHESWLCKGGIEGGGAHKRVAAEAGKPGFTLSREHVSADLIAVLDGLYALLKEHYSSLDFAEYEKYSAPRSHPPTLPVPPQPSVNQGQPRRRHRFKEYITVSGLSGVQARGPPETFPPVVPTATLPPRGTLNSHQAMLELIVPITNSIFYRSTNGDATMKPDKTKDQFAELPELTVVVPKGSTGSRQSSKRKSESSRGEEAKRVCTGSTNDLATVAE